MAEDKTSKQDPSGSKENGKTLDDMKAQNGFPNNKDKEPELSEEDKALVEKLNLLVERSQDKEEGVRKMALEQIRSEIRSATSSMTSVPKPLKFLTDHYEPLKKYWFDNDGNSEVGKLMADVLSVMAMTMSKEEKDRECLKFKLAGQMDDIDTWGHEYVRYLAGQIGREFADIKSEEDKGDVSMESDPFPDVSVEDLKRLVNQIVPFFMKSNAEAEAVDLVTELQMLDTLPGFTDEHNHSRVCLYLESIAPFFPEPEDAAVLSNACKIYAQNNKPSHALKIAMRLSDPDLVKSILNPTSESTIKLTPAIRKQLILDLGASCNHPKQGQEEEFLEEQGAESAELEVLKKLAFNRNLSKYYRQLAKELQVLEPKHPSDIYKEHLIEGVGNSSSAANSDSARANLASTYVNAFVNAGFGTDRLLMVDNIKNGDEKEKDGSVNDAMDWILRNRDHGMMAAAASLGLIQLWDGDYGIHTMDNIMHSSQEFVRAGALLGIGIISSRVRTEFDPAFTLLVEFVTAKIDDSSAREGLLSKIAAIAGLGIGYAGTDGEECKELLKDFLTDPDVDPNISAMAALAIGLISVGTADGDLSSKMVECLEYRLTMKPEQGTSLVNILLPLGLGLIYLGRGEEADIMMTIVSALAEDSSGPNHDLKKIVPLVLESCAYAGSGSVIKIQNLLGIVGRHESSGKDGGEEKEGDGTAANDKGSSAAGESSSSGGDAQGTNANGTTANGPSAADGASNEAAESSNANQNGTGNNEASSAATENGQDNANSETSSDEAKEDDASLFAAEQACAVLGIAMISMGEDIGGEMVQRIYGHMLHYGEPAVKRTVPIAMGLTSVSNPQIAIMEILSKLSHDSDLEVAQNAIFGLGLIGAGTNNSRIANLLRQLSVYFSKDPGTLFLVRIAQALLHAGKGLVTLNPYHGDGKGVLNKVGLAGLLVVLYSALDMKTTLMGRNHYLLFFLALTLRPRMLFTIDEEGEFLPVTVRVGQAVDTVGQAGRPKRITGFQTHSTPVLLAAGERAELGTEEFISLAAGLQDVVILQKNPEYDEGVDLETVVKTGMMEIDSKAEDKAASSKAGPAPKTTAT